MDTIVSNAITFFLISNPIGNSPLVLAMVKRFPFEKQKHILLREGIFSLIVALFFQYLGAVFMQALHLDPFTVSLCGGFVLFVTALRMIFNKDEGLEKEEASLQEPYFVPIAIPLLSGPGLLSIIMIKSQAVNNSLYVSASVILAFIGVIGIMIAAPYLKKLLGERGLAALEQFMGMILGLISMGMLVRGASLFYQTLGA